MQTQTASILPGDALPSQLIPSSGNRTLKLGPGLRHVPPSTLKATIGGTVSSDTKKNAVWIEYDGGRYIPSTNDLIIAQILRSSGEHYTCSITPYAPPAVLPHLAFSGATKKTRPQLHSGDLVYARISYAPKNAEVELECLNPSTGKSDGLGPLKEGMCWDISTAFARRLMKGTKGGVAVLEELSKNMQFEIAVGRNGRVWVDAGDEIENTILVGRALKEVNENNMGIEQQREICRRLMKETGQAQVH